MALSRSLAGSSKSSSVPLERVSQRTRIEIGSYWLVKAYNEFWPAIVCDRDMLPENFPKQRTSQGGANFYPVLTMVKHEFVWVPHKNLRVFEPSYLFEAQLDKKSPSLARAHRATGAVDGLPRDLDYWNSYMLAERLQKGRDPVTQSVASPAQASANQSRPLTVSQGKRKCVDVETNPPSDIKDSEEAELDDEPLPKRVRRGEEILIASSESDVEDDDEILPRSSTPEIDTLAETFERPTPATSAAIASTSQSCDTPAGAGDARSQPTREQTPHLGSSERAATQADSPLFEPDGAMVAFIIGEDSTPVRVPKSSVMKPELLHLTECMTWDDELGWHITRPLYSAFTVARFQAVAGFLTHGDFNPKLLDDSDRRARLDGVESIAQKADALLDCGRAFNVAREVQLPEMTALVVRKVCVLRPWPAAEVLMVTNFVFHEPPTGLDADDDLRKLLCNHIAENFWEINSTQATNLKMILTRYPELEENVFSARLEKLRLSTPDSGMGEED